jgi:metal-responsive CopG/Arc/MetJ family transcriptional regulator
MGKERLVKERLVTVRLTEEEASKLDLHTQNDLMNRSQVLRLLVRHFVNLSEKEQRDFLSRELFGK